MTEYWSRILKERDALRADNERLLTALRKIIRKTDSDISDIEAANWASEIAREALGER